MTSTSKSEGLHRPSNEFMGEVPMNSWGMKSRYFVDSLADKHAKRIICALLSMRNVKRGPLLWYWIRQGILTEIIKREIILRGGRLKTVRHYLESAVHMTTEASGRECRFH
jgi:hypothetical protein